MAELAERIELLRRVRLFSNLNRDELEAIDAILEGKRFKKGSVVFAQGDEGDALYIVESGRIKASIKDDQGREKVLGVFSEGDYFGEIALLNDQPRTATMTVVGDAQVFMLPKTSFEKFLASNLEVMRQFVNLMSRRLAESSSLVRSDEASPEQGAGQEPGGVQSQGWQRQDNHCRQSGGNAAGTDQQVGGGRRLLVPLRRRWDHVQP
ncbi:MAG: cyclic nucleotide-binding domain-containing protein [Dehalococcoidia bacterium]|nr:cyclic nucleotide-binding domain-containing protein [Dehalococcoidia bacterium]